MTKETYPFSFLPFLQLGWNVVNVEYRRAQIALAPAAVEDCLCALRWVGLHAGEYNIDANRIVIMGRSAGGHLALTTGMISQSMSGLGEICGSMRGPIVHGRDTSVRPAAIVNWFGVTDVVDLLDGPNRRTFAIAWLGNQADRAELAKLVSPINYVREDLPPIVTVHGSEDPVVPYDHAVRLHAALTNVGVNNRLITISGGGHGQFGLDTTRDAYAQIFEFLKSVGLPVEQGSVQ